MRNSYKIWSANLEEEGCLGDTAGRLTLMKKYMMVWNQLNYLKTCTIAGCCEHGSEPSSYIKRWGISEDGLCSMDFN
jgi:hypothetical protein